MPAVERHPLEKKPPEAMDGHDWFARLGLGILLLVFALVIYLPGFKGPFIFDDWGSVGNNPYIHIRDFKPATLFKAAFQNGLQNRPLSNLSFALNYYFGQLNSLGYHVVNFLFFCLTALGIWLLLERLFVRLGFKKERSLLAAWLAALLWTAHPLNTQAVSYIVQRHTSFAGAFSIWSIYFFHLVIEVKKRRLLFFALCALSGICALLCKETALTLPAIILLYKIYFFDDLKPGWLRQNVKWIIALAVIYGMGAAVALRPEMLERIRPEIGGKQVMAWGKFLSEPRTLFWYLYLIIFPFPQFLSLIHKLPLSTGLFHPFTTVISWAALLAVVAMALARARRWRIFSFAVLWYLGSLAVEALPLPIDLVNEHRLYLALLSLLVPACAGPVLKVKSFKLAPAWALVVVLFFGFFTFSRNRVWAGNEIMWEDVVQKAPDSAQAYNNHGLACVAKGQIDQALKDYSKAINLAPTHFPAVYYNRGNAYAAIGQFPLAIRDFGKAIESSPKYTEAYGNRGLAYNGQGRFELAVRDFNRVLELEPNSSRAYNNRGIAYSGSGQTDLAIEDFSKAIELDPGFATAYFNRGVAYSEKGQTELAKKDFEQARELDPEIAGKNK